MTRISSVNDPAYQIELLKGRVEALERRNPLNNASIDPDVPGISAGSNVFNASGFQSMWGGELRSWTSVASGLNSKADGIQSQVNTHNSQISSLQSLTGTHSSQISSLQSQINNAASSGDVAALQTQLDAFVQSVDAVLTLLQTDVNRLKAWAPFVGSRVDVPFPLPPNW